MLIVSCSKDESFQQSTDLSLTVSMKGNTFTPLNAMIVRGGSVTWVNDDTVTHRIVRQEELFDVKTIVPGARFTYTFTQTGNHNYRCIDHDGIGSVLVVEK